MKRNTKSSKFNLVKIFVAVLFAVALIFGIVAANGSGAKSAYAYITDSTNADYNMPSSDKIIDNIYLGGGKFNRGNLDKLATKVGYTGGVVDLVAAASGFTPTEEQPGFKTSADFGETLVNFGSYTFGGIQHELTWIPSYLSKDESGDAILTLWLAGTDSANGTVSNQEVTSYSDGTYSEDESVSPSSNNYSTSYIRALINNGGTYYGGYGTQLKETTYPTSSDGSNKFEVFTTGGLANYIVAPNQVSWQKDSDKLKNDPKWNGVVGGNYTPTGWLNDKLWLPSIYEVFDNSLGANNSGDVLTENGGLWQTGNSTDRSKRVNMRSSWLRTGIANNVYRARILDSTGGCDHIRVHGVCAVRPALHLNLSKAAENSFNTIDNIYDEMTNKFSAVNLDTLAQAAQFTDLQSMVQTAQSGTIKTSADFGETLVNFGSYTFGGIQHELTWIPSYLSKDESGDAILTLWLAGTDSVNGIVSNQEVSTFSGGTYSINGAINFNGNDVYSNTYDGSYVRNYILNGSNTYASGFGSGTAIQPPEKPEVNTLTKFTQFTTGDLANYIVSPANVGWQNSASYLKNDAKWNASGKTTEAFGTESFDIVGKAENYPSGWLSDKIWLPSIYEMYDGTISSEGTRSWNFEANGGLWETDSPKRTNNAWAWLRSGYPTYYHSTYALGTDGSYSRNNVNSIGAVRPALHLNLSDAACSVDVHVWNDGEDTVEATCTTTGVKTFTCVNCGETRTETTAARGHNYGEVVWNWADDGKSATATKTCTRCAAGVEGHELSGNASVADGSITWEIDPNSSPTCTSNGTMIYYATITLKGTQYTDSKFVVNGAAALGHNYGEVAWTWADDGKTATATKTCTRCAEGVEGHELSGTATLDSSDRDNIITATSDVLQPATCSEKGWTNYTATVTLDGTPYTSVKSVQDVDKIAHTYGNVVWAWADDGKSATATKTCTVCAAGVEGHEISETATIDNGITAAADPTKPATCTRKGTTVYTAAITLDGVLYTDEKSVQDVQTVPHNYDTTVWQKDGTNHWHVCTVCGAAGTKFAHTDSEWVTDTEPTCTTAGSKHKTCPDCGEIFATGTISAKGHTDSEWVTDTEPTCTTAGSKHKTCPDCNQTVATETIPAKGHTLSPWKHDENEHWKECSVCSERVDVAGHNWSDWKITKEPTASETGEKTCSCSVCGQHKAETIAKIVQDEGGSGNVSDLPVLTDPDSNYELEITVKATDKIYALEGVSKGYDVQLWIVDGEANKHEYDSGKEVTLSLIVPDGMEEFTLYKLENGVYEVVEASAYTMENGVLRIRTTLPKEFVFNSTTAKAGIPWWVWLLVGIGAALIIAAVVVIVVVIKKKQAAAGVKEYDDAELKARLDEQGKRIDELANRDDGGFNDVYRGE